MLKLADYNHDLLKDEMKSALLLKTESVTAIKKRSSNYSTYESALAKNKKLKNLYSIGKTLPVRVGGIVINYKLYQSFVKKLRGFEMELKQNDGVLTLNYWKFGSKTKGKLALSDIGHYYQDFYYIPKAELEVL